MPVIFFIRYFFTSTSPKMPPDIITKQIIIILLYVLINYPYNNIKLAMSFFISNEDFYPSAFKIKQSTQINSLKQFWINLQKTLRKDCRNLIASPDESSKITVPIQLNKEIRVLVQIQMNFNKQFQNDCGYMHKNYFKVTALFQQYSTLIFQGTLNRKIKVCQLIAKQNKNDEESFFAINMQNGLLMVRLPLIEFMLRCLLQQYHFKNSFQNNIFKKLQKNIDNLVNQWMQIFKKSWQQQNNWNGDKIMQYISYYSNINRRNSQKSLREKGIHQIKFTSLSLFVLDWKKIFSQLKKNKGLTDQEIQNISRRLAMPILPKPINKHDNNSVLNYIKIDSTEIDKTKIAQGGFSSIYHTQVSFWYVYSSEKEEFIESDIKLKEESKLSKLLVVKQGGIKIGHQIQILRRIKNGEAIFLPKKNNCDVLLLDYLPFGSLQDYIYLTQSTLSLRTILTLMLSIGQGLRYLRYYDITHLDLKPENIMMYCNLFVRFIDFGQSHHPKVCSKNFRPGYTLPYTPPEVFASKPNFSPKSDLFSLAVIFYRLLYSKAPFYFQQRMIKKSSDGRYLSEWFLAPQEVKYIHFGINYLNMLISASFNPESNNRLELDCIVLALRQLIQAQGQL